VEARFSAKVAADDVRGVGGVATAHQPTRVSFSSVLNLKAAKEVVSP